MCDCYYEKCNRRKCKVIVPIHLGDFNTGRKEVLVYCKNHIPKRKMSTVFVFKTNEGIFGMRALTLNASANFITGKNHPNTTESEFLEVLDD